MVVKVCSHVLIAICVCFGFTVAVDPVILTSQNSTSLTVTWNKAFDDENNAAEWYEITYEESDCSLANSTSFITSNTTITVDELNATLVDNTTLQYNLTGLNKWTGYIVVVTAFLSNGSKLGDTSSVKCQTTLEDAPTGPPVNVTVSALNASRISLSWAKPNKSVLHGNLVRYEVEYRRVVCNESDPVSVSDSSWKSVQVADTSVSMTIGRLVFWSCYEVRMRAVTVDNGPYSDAIEVRTMENAPTGPPVNVTVTAVNSSSLQVGWIKPDKSVLHGNLVRYEVEYRRVVCSESDPVSVSDGSWKSVQVANISISTEIGNLVFWSCYKVRMRAVTVGNGPYSENMQVRTKEHAPTAAPVSVAVTALNASRISVSWTRPNKSVLHGNLVRYEVEYKRVECSESDPVNVTGESWKIVNLTSTSSSTQIGNLVYWSCYDVRIRAVTVGSGPYSESVQVRTEEHEPTGPPVSVSVTAIDASGISVSWTKPNKSVLHGNLVRYEVEYKRVECNESDPVSVADGSWKSLNVSSASLSVEIFNLTFWSCYQVRVRAVTVGSGPFSNVIDVRTKEHAPTEAPVSVTVTAIDASRISVSWVKPNKSVLHGDLVRYEVEYKRIECNESDPVSVADSSWKSVQVANTSVSTEIGSLVFWSCYEVRMRAITVGNGPYSENMQVRTKEHAPTGSPVNVTASAVNSSRLAIGWIKPDKSVLHGNLVRYEVEYRRVVCNESDPVSVSDGSWKSVQVANTSISTEIGNLVFWSCYEVRMRAVTVDNGPYSDVIDVRTKEHAPTAAPVNVTVKAINSSLVSVSWSKPEKYVLHGNLVRYEIEYRRVVCNESDPVNVTDGSWKSVNLTNTSLSVEIGNLAFWSCYEVRMRAVTVGNGPYSDVIRVRTKEDAPTGAPVNVTVKAINSSSVSVSWSKPDKSVLHGNLRRYEIEYRRVQCGESHPVRVSGEHWHVLLVANASVEATISRLIFWSCYDVRMRAVSIGRGPYSPIMQVRTKEHAPTGPPVNVTITAVNSSSLQVGWVKPDKSLLHGNLVRYEVEYRRVVCNEPDPVSVSDGSWKSVQVADTSVSMKIGKLVFWSCYEVRMRAVTVGSGPYSDVIKVRTKEHSPTEAPVIAALADISPSSISVSWRKPDKSVLHGKLLRYEVEYKRVVCNESDPVSVSDSSWKSVNVKSTSLSVEIDSLIFWSCYEVRIRAVTVGNGPYSNTKGVRTKEHAPSGAPVNVTVNSISSTSIAVNWSKPDKSVLHGNLRRYIVEYKRVECDESDPVRVAGEEWKTLQVANTSENTDIGNLVYWSCYELRIRAVTVGIGPNSDVIKVRTKEHAPTKPPTITSFGFINSTSLKIDWLPPPKNKRHGYIREYRIFIAKGLCVVATTLTTPRATPTTSEGKPKTEGRFLFQNSMLSASHCQWKGIIVHGNVENYTFVNLRKWTNYSVYVDCKTVGRSNASEVWTNSTDEDTPGAPATFTCNNNTKRAIEANWQKPKQPNGIILGYTLTWVPGQAKTSLEFKTDEFSGSVSNLSIYTVYNLTLRAKTKKGLGEPISCSRRTTDEAPSSPQSFKATVVSAWQINLNWLEPERKNGEIRKYEIDVREEIGNKEIEKSTTENTFFEARMLEPFTSYTFSVKAIGSGGDSEKVTTSAKTFISSPPPVTHTVPQPSNEGKVTTFEVRLIKFSEENGKILYNLVFVFVGKKPSNKTSEFVSKSFENAKIGVEPYVAARLQPFPTNGIFVIGDGGETTVESKRKRRSVSGKYKNQPLEPSKDYSWFQRGCVAKRNLKGKDLCSSTEWQEFRTNPLPDEPSSVGTIVAIVVVLFVLAVVIFGGVYYKRRYPDRLKMPCTFERGGSVKNGVQDNDGFEVDGEFDGAVNRRNFQEYFSSLSQNQNYQFSEKFKTIQAVPQGVSDNTDREVNRPKNRYTNIKAYDHTRVKLKPSSTPGSDYINANYIDGYKKRAAYIACQGPLDSTIEDFWTMVWEQGISIIVMVTRVEERGRIKCAQYWPLAGSMNYGSFQIYVSESTQLPDYNVTVLNVINMREPGKDMFIRHFHFLQWPDFGVPISPDALLSFIRKVNDNTPPDGGPVVVHCSAGVGRTGTYIVLDTCLKQLANEGTVDPHNFLRHIRTQRNYLVQTEAQYIFIHEALLEFIKCGKTEVSANGLRDRIKMLKEQTQDGTIRLSSEFQLLNEYSQVANQNFKAASAPCNKIKNRYLTCLPFDESRVALKPIHGVPGSDYINASFVDGYMKQRAFIATQAPLPSTVDDFWRMVWEQQSCTVVCLIVDSESARTRMQPYWPDREPRKCGPLLIEHVSESRQTDFVVRNLKVTNSQSGSSRMIRHFQFTSWSDNQPPQNGSGIIDFIGQIQKWQLQTGDHIVIVHCSTGVGRSGVYISLCNLIERLKTEGIVDVFRAVRHLKRQRPGMVQTQGQYFFCHIALQDYLASFDVYSNFT